MDFTAPILHEKYVHSTTFW